MSTGRSAQQWYQIGDVARRARDLRQAEEAFRRAADIDPSHANAIYRLGELAAHRGDTVAADQLFRRTLSIQPDHAWAKKQLQRLARATPSPKPEPAPAGRPTCSPEGSGIVGVVQSVRRSVESFDMRSGSRPVLSLRVRTSVANDQTPSVVAAEMRGRQIRGQVEPGDWVEFPADWVPGENLKVFRNLTTCGKVQIISRRFVAVATVAIVTFVVIWIAVLFFVVARELFFS